MEHRDEHQADHPRPVQQHPRAGARTDTRMTPVDLSDFTEAERLRLIKFVCKRVHDRELAEEIAQAAIAKALTSNFNGACSRRSWLCTIAYSICLEHWRRGKREFVPVDSIELTERKPSPLESAQAKERRHKLTKVISGLPRCYREVISLYYFSEMSFEEIARQRKVAVGTVKSLAFRARQMLRERMLTRAAEC